MYASFFALRELPFNNTPDPRFFFSTPDHEEALASLIYAISEAKGFVLLTGEVGSGKTLVTRLMLRHFGDRIAFACVNNTQVSANEMLQAICAEFDIPAPAGASNIELIRMLQDYLLSQFAQNRPVVLMLDEAQALSREAFEQVRMIGNLESDDAKLLQIVIVGQQELRERFKANDMRQLRQRIFRSFHLPALTREQTYGYIRHRLTVAGSAFPDEIIDESAMALVHEYSQGLPRLINTVCDNTLLSAYAADQHMLNASFVRHVITQMMGGADVTPASAEFEQHPSLRQPVERRADDLLIVEERLRRRFEQQIEAKLAEANAALNPIANRAVEVEGQLRGLGSKAKETGEGVKPAVAQLDRPARQAFDAADAALRSIVDRAVDAEERLHALIERAAQAEAQVEPAIERLEKMTKLAKQSIEQTKAAISQTRDAISSAPMATSNADEATAQFADQAERTGRLSVALRNTLEKMKGRTQKRTPPAARHGTSTGAKGAREVPAWLIDRTRELDRIINNNRSAVEEIRSLITATKAGTPQRTTADGHAATAMLHPRSSQLASEVRSLAAMIESTRRKRPRAPFCRAVSLARPHSPARRRG